MSYRGRGGGGFGARGGSRGGSRGGYGGGSFGPPDQVLELGSFVQGCEGDLVCESTNPKIPYFNAPIYLENKSQIGKVDEILGPMNQVYFTIKPQEGVVATSFKSGDKFYIGPDKLLPLERFLPKPKSSGRSYDTRPWLTKQARFRRNVEDEAEVHQDEADAVVVAEERPEDEAGLVDREAAADHRLVAEVDSAVVARLVVAVDSGEDSAVVGE